MGTASSSQPRFIETSGIGSWGWGARVGGQVGAGRGLLATIGNICIASAAHGFACACHATTSVAIPLSCPSPCSPAPCHLPTRPRPVRREQFTAAAAQVVCRSLNLVGGRVLEFKASSALRPLAPLLTHVRCGGAAKDLSVCQFKPASSCPNGRFAGVACQCECQPGFDSGQACASRAWYAWACHLCACQSAPFATG